jgi:hypothetical protein
MGSLPQFFWKAETHGFSGFGQTGFSIYHNPPKSHLFYGSFLVLDFGAFLGEPFNSHAGLAAWRAASQVT